MDEIVQLDCQLSLGLSKWQIFQLILYKNSRSYNTRMKAYLILTLAYVATSILDRTYYDALELPVSASQDDIRESFRRLSRKYHPDRNPEAKGQFEKINVAYEVLFNEQKKFLYDRVGKQQMNDPMVYNKYNFQALKGPELKIKLFLYLKDLYLGKSLQVMIQKQIACPHCRGTGADNPKDIVKCHDCDGKGRTTRRVDLGGGYYNLFTQTCPRCQGKGEVIGRVCHVCRRQMIIPGLEQFNIKIRPGTASDANLRYTNMGDQRLQGAPSDVVFQIVEITDKLFKREGNDLRMTMEITLQQAILGFKKTFKHLDGREVSIQEEGITQPGSIKLIEGEGMPILGSPEKGNLYISFKVKIPDFSSEQLDILQQFFNKRK